MTRRLQIRKKLEKSGKLLQGAGEGQSHHYRNAVEVQNRLA
jgi:hypothetical protein